jgi:hypothetical protein
VVLIVVYLFFLIPLWAAGLVSLFRSAILRPIGIACLFPLVLRAKRPNPAGLEPAP